MQRLLIKGLLCLAVDVKIKPQCCCEERPGTSSEGIQYGILQTVAVCR